MQLFSRPYRCHSPSSTIKPELEQGNKILLPQSALVSLLSLDNISYPMMFQLMNSNADKISYCGILEFTSEEGIAIIPKWMLCNMNLEDGQIVQVKNVTLAKGTYVKLQPHSKDFLDIANPKAVLENKLRNYACLHAGGTIMIEYNDRSYHIDVLETKPCDAVHIIETDCEVDFAPPLDYKCESSDMNEIKRSGSKCNGKLVFGSSLMNAAKKKVEFNGAESLKEKVNDHSLKKEESKNFQAFTGKMHGVAERSGWDGAVQVERREKERLSLLII